MRAWMAGLVAISLMTAGSLGGGTAAAAPEDERDVRAASAGFYKALSAMLIGDLAPMKAVWCHADDVTYMGPFGAFRVGWKQVLPDWEGQAAKKLGGKVEATDVRVTVGGGLAVVSNHEKCEMKGPGGKKMLVLLRVTSVYRKEGGQWKMIGHHTDNMPVQNGDA